MDREICEIKKTLVEEVRLALAKGISDEDVHNLGEVVDMIKDIGQYEYYHSIAKAMESEEGSKDRRRGYWPNPDEKYWLDMLGGPREVYDPMRLPNMRMGYTRDYERDRDMDRRYGREYDEYERARRHYTTTKDVADKLEMEDHAKKHLMDMMSSVKDIWHEASPELRQRMKADITNLANELN